MPLKKNPLAEAIGYALGALIEQDQRAAWWRRMEKARPAA